MTPVCQLSSIGLDVTIREHVLHEPRERMFGIDKKPDGTVTRYLTTAMDLGAPAGLFSENPNAALFAARKFCVEKNLACMLDFGPPAVRVPLSPVVTRVTFVKPGVPVVRVSRQTHESPARALVYAMLDALKITEVEPWWTPFFPE